MRTAGSGPAARKVGVAIAREMLAAVRHRVAGAYVMPPLERYELALEVIDGFTDDPAAGPRNPPPSRALRGLRKLPALGAAKHPPRPPGPRPPTAATPTHADAPP